MKSLSPLFSTLNTTSTKPPSSPLPPGYSTKLQNSHSPLFSSLSSGLGSTKPLMTTINQQEQLLAEIKELTGKDDLNMNSPQQLSKAIFGEPGQQVSMERLDSIAGGGDALAGKVFRWKVLERSRRKMVSWEERKKRSGGLRISSNSARSYSTESSGVEFDDDVNIDENDLVDDDMTGDLVDDDSSASTINDNEDISSPREASLRPRREPLLLVDASAYIFRAYYSMPPLHRSDGTPTGAVLGFCNMINRLVLNKLINGETPRLVLVFDAKGKNFRHELYEEYKANRPPCPVDLIPQFELVREAAKAFGIPQLEAAGYEADDVIATLATRAWEEGVNVNIVSSDKDLMQLVTAPSSNPCSIHLIDPMKQLRVDHDKVIEKWGVSADKLGDVLALAGDTADNVPGVKGIGPKIAAELINSYGGLNGVYENVEGIKQPKRRERLVEGKDLAMLSRKLVELERAVPPGKITGMEGVNVCDLRMEGLDKSRLLDFFKKMGFRDLRRRVSNMIASKV